MSFAPTIPFPVAIWTEPALASAAVPLQRIYFAQDPVSGAWSLDTSPANEAARLADLTGTGIYDLEPLSAINPTTPTLRIVLRNGTDTLIY